MSQSTNPVKHYRETFGLSLTDLEQAANIHRQTIIRTEQGCYAQIPPKLYNYLLARIGPGHSSLSHDYASWVATKRRDSFGRLDTRLPEFNPQAHPFTSWRQVSDVGRLEFCKLFCVHPSTVGRFENDLTMQSIPEQLRDGLIVSGYQHTLLDDLSVRYNIFREYQLALNSKDTVRILKAQSNALAYVSLHDNGVTSIIQEAS